MSRYVLPTFNVSTNIWRFGSGPPAVPDVVVDGNLSPGKITGVATSTSPAMGSGYAGEMWLRLPALTDIRDGAAPGGADVVECPAGSGRLYNVTWVDEVAAGFANEHRFATLVKKVPWPVPFPGGLPPPPPPPAPFTFFNQFLNTTFGAPIPFLVLNAAFTQVVGQMGVVYFTTYNYFGGAPIYTDSAGPQPLVPVAGPTLVLGITVQVWSLYVLGVRATGPAGITYPAMGAAIAQGTIFQIQGSPTPSPQFAVAGAGVTLIPLKAIGPTITNPSALSAWFAAVGPNLPDVWALPFLPGVGSVQDVIMGQVCRSSLGQCVVNPLAIYTATTGLVNSAAWDASVDCFI